MNKITAWSYSRYSEWRTCPFKAKCKIIDKLKEPAGEAMDRGTDIHKMAENYLTGRIDKLPADLKQLKKEYTALKKLKPEVEKEFAFRNDWTKCDWFAKDAWCRVKIDILIPPKVENPIVSVKDTKTGKFKEDGEYQEQLDLYNLTGLLVFPIAQIAKSSLLFVDHGKEVEGDQLKRKDEKKMKKIWELRVKPMLSDTKFRPTPNFTCRWCHFRKSNGGPCPEDL